MLSDAYRGIKFCSIIFKILKGEEMVIKYFQIVFKTVGLLFVVIILVFGYRIISKDAQLRRIGAQVAKKQETRGCDFSKSFITLCGRSSKSNTRIKVEARCEIHDTLTGQTKNYYLLASCKGEDTYSKGRLFLDPPYDFSMIIADKEFLIIRNFANTLFDNVQPGFWKEAFGDIDFYIKMARIEQLSDKIKIAMITEGSVIINGRIEISDQSGRYRAILEFPIKTLNVSKENELYQVDTGPILLPDFSSSENKAMIERFNIAFVAYNNSYEAYFIIKEPTAITADAKNKTSFYSHIIRLNSVNSIFKVK